MRIKCNKCGVNKAEDNFYKHPYNITGRFYSCKKCYLEQVKARQNSPEGKVKRYEYIKSYRARLNKLGVKRFRDLPKQPAVND